MCSNWLFMCSTLCLYNWICTWAFSWLHLAHIHIAVHVYINCTMLSLWALSWGVYHTAASTGPLPSLLEKIICLASCQQDKLGKISHPGCNSAALIRESSHVLWVCSLWVSCAFTVLWHQPCAILRGRTDLFYGGEKWWCCVSHSVPFAFCQQGKSAWLFSSLLKFFSVSPKGTERFTCSLLKQCAWIYHETDCIHILLGFF